MLTLEQARSKIAAIDKAAQRAVEVDGTCLPLYRRARDAGKDESVPTGLLSLLFGELEGEGWKITLDPHDPLWDGLEADGVTSYCEKRILLRHDVTLATLFRVALHEAGHAWGKISLGNETCSHSNASEETRRRIYIDETLAEMTGGFTTWLVENEVEAELTSWIVCDALGITQEHAPFYIASHRRKSYKGTTYFDETIMPRAWESAKATADRILAIFGIAVAGTNAGTNQAA